MCRHPIANAVSLTAAMLAAGLLVATGASAKTMRLKASDVTVGKARFAVPDGKSLKVRYAKLRTGRSTRRLPLRKVRRGVRRGRVDVRIKRRRARRVRLVMRVRRKGPRGPKPSEPTLSDPPSTPIAGTEPVPADAFYVAPTGSDSNPGSAAKPWRTLQKAVAAVKPGDTVVLRAGTYGSRGKVVHMTTAGASSAPITYRGYPGEPMPRILGFFKITASHQRFSYMLFDGPTGSVKTPTSHNPRGEEVQVSVYGSAVNGIEISHSEIRDSDWHAGIFLSGASNARILANHIHGNGDENDPGQANQSHGIYWHSGSGLIANNVIEDNLARGVQLYEEPSNVTIANNTIVGNGKAGIQFAHSTRDTIAINNLVASNEYGIRTDSLTGGGNVVRNNMLWGNTRGDLALTNGLSLVGNQIADARFMGADDFRLRATSLAVDAALASFAPSFDFLSTARPFGDKPDLGAYESH